MERVAQPEEPVPAPGQAADQARRAWADTPAPARGQILYRALDILERRAEEIARTITIEHPTGRIEIELVTSGGAESLKIERAAVIRTTRRLFEGFVLIPSSVWQGEQAA